ncbi:hypothetical protein [Taibaiella chishuiensis]|uniref:hypothetical protein n=1 Tax=Taibaiella chishuiensis TaxID=1434707 RepID=UPI000D0DB7D7|nr:hypothetical protein [Taibaiella chishuiensis]
MACKDSAYTGLVGINAHDDMSLYGPGSFFKLQVSWKDADMLELAVSASNGRYTGYTEVYDTEGSLYHLAEGLAAFPGKEQVLVYEAGLKAGYAFCGLKFYLVHPAGSIGWK